MINYIISNKKLNIEYISYIGKNNQIYKKKIIDVMKLQYRY